MVQEHQKALLNYWGLDVGHTATCLTIPNEWNASTPETLLSIWQKNTSEILTRFVPKARNGPILRTYQRCFFRADGNRLRDHGIKDKVPFDSTKQECLCKLHSLPTGEFRTLTGKSTLPTCVATRTARFWDTLKWRTPI